MSDFNFTMNDETDVDVVRYKLQLNPLASKKAGRNIYHGVVIKKETYGTVQLAKRLAAECGMLREASIRMVLSELANLVGTLVSQGRSVNIGGVIRFMPVIHGTFDSTDEEWNPKKHKVRVNACVGTRLRKIAEQSPVARVGVPTVPVLQQVINLTLKKQGVISARSLFNVIGSRLSWDASAADEGWFINLGGEEYKCPVESASSDIAVSLRCERTFAEAGTPLLLIFRTRLGGKVLHQIAYPRPLVTA